MREKSRLHLSGLIDGAKPLRQRQAESVEHDFVGLVRCGHAPEPDVPLTPLGRPGSQHGVAASPVKPQASHDAIRYAGCGVGTPSCRLPRISVVPLRRRAARECGDRPAPRRGRLSGVR